MARRPPRTRNKTAKSAEKRVRKSASRVQENLLKENQLNTDEERAHLSRLAEVASRPNCRFLEVGSWCGDSTTILGRVAKSMGGKVLAVDWWRGNEGTELQSLASENDILKRFRERMENEGLGDVVVPFVARSDIASSILREGQFDLIFIDGDHRYEQALMDILNFAPLLNSEGAIFCGHDCDGKVEEFDVQVLEDGKHLDVFENLHCGVILAVDEAIPKYEVKCQIWSTFWRKGSGWNAIDVAFPVDKNDSEIKFNLDAFDIVKNSSGFGLLQQPNVVDSGKEIPPVYREYVEDLKCVAEELLDGPAGDPSVVQEVCDYHGYRIVLFDGQAIGLQLSLDEVEVTAGAETLIRTHGEDNVIAGQTPDEIKKEIDLRRTVVELGDAEKALVALQGDISRLRYGPAGDPSVVQEVCDYHGYRIVLFDGQAIGLQLSLDEVEVTAGAETLIRTHGEDNVIAGQTPDEIKKEIDLILLRGDLCRRLEVIRNTCERQSAEIGQMNVRFKKIFQCAKEAPTVSYVVAIQSVQLLSAQYV